MTEEEFTKKYPWIDPTKGYPDDTLIRGVEKANGHVAVCVGGAHKSLPFMKAYHSKDLEHISGQDWRLFHIYLRGVIPTLPYVWGMFVEGLGFLHVMVPCEFIRELTQEERDIWSKKTLSMVGSHTGKVSYMLPSGVKPV